MKTTETTTPVELDAKAKYIASVETFMSAYKDILGSEHPMSDELSYKMLGAYGLALRQIKRLKKVTPK